MKTPRKTSTLKDADFDAGLVGQNGGETSQGCARRGVHLLHVDEFEVRVEADENGRQADEGVQRRDELRHLRHLDPHRDLPTDDGRDHEDNEDQPEMAAVRPEHRWKHGERHADDAVPDRPLGTFLVRQAPERQNEENGGGNIGRRNDADAQRNVSSGLLEHGEHPARDQESTDDVDRCCQRRDGCQQDDEPVWRADLQQGAE